MIIEFCDDLLPLCEDDERKDTVIEAAMQVAASVRRGYHVLGGSRKVLQYFARCDRLGDRRGVYISASEGIAIKRSLYRFVNAVLRIYSGNKYYADVIDGLKYIYIPVQNAAFEIKFDSSVVAAENSVDAEFYFALGRRYALNGFGRGPVGAAYEVRASIRGVGGSQAPAELQRYARARSELVLCVVDGDLLHPGDRYGQNAVSAQEVILNAGYPLVYLHILNARCVDSIIPLNLLQQVPQSEKAKHLFEYKKKIIEAERICKMNFFKYVKLSSNAKLRSYKSSDCAKCFISYFIEMLEVPVNDCECSNPPFDPCTCDHGQNCKVVITRRYRDILKELISATVGFSDELFVIPNENYAKDSWMEVGKCVFTWFCGEKHTAIA